MDERTYFAVAAAVGLMQTVEAGVILSRGGRLSAAMCLPSAVEATWFGATVLALINGSISSERTVWPWAFLAYFAVYSLVGSSYTWPRSESVSEESSLSENMEKLRLPTPLVLASLAFTIPYAIASFLTLRSL